MRQSPDSQVYTSLRDLARLRYKARGFSYLPRQPIGSLLAGRKRSRLRGRGLDFDELRHYRPGDDIRTMDWRVTNRTGKPHVRVYREERDRPVFLVVDQRLSMFFGSQSRMKSVVAAEVAALTAWRVTSVGDRVGAIIFNDSKRHESRPARSSQRVMGWLGELTRMNQALSVDTQLGGGEHALNGALQLLERSIGHDYLVIVISDFHGWNDATLSSLRRLSQHNDVVCSLIFDPLERDISAADQLVVSDGQLQLAVEPAEQDLGERFTETFDNTFNRVQATLKRYDIPLMSIDTVASPVEQIRDTLGGGRPR